MCFFMSDIGDPLAVTFTEDHRWDPCILKAAQCIAEFESGFVNAMALTNPTRLFLTGGESSVKLWNIATMRDEDCYELLRQPVSAGVRFKQSIWL